MGGRELITSEGGYEPMNRLLLMFNIEGGDCDDVLFYSLNDPAEAQAFQTEMRTRFGKELKANPSAIVMDVVKGNLPCRKLNVKAEYNTKFMNIYDLMSKD